MTLTILLLFTPILFSIIYQDFKDRAVVWFLFPLIAILSSITQFFVGKSTKLFFQGVFFNIAFLLIQFTLLYLYFVIKDKKMKINFKEKIGLGDILFLLAICFLLSPFNFIAYYIISLFMSLVVYLFYLLLPSASNKQPQSIPLAGLQSFFLFITLIVDCLYNDFTIFNDDYLLRILLPT